MGAELNPGPSEFAELTTAFGELANLIAPPGGTLTPTRLVIAAQRAAPNVEGAALTVLPPRSRPRSMAATGPLPRRADELQYSIGEGPCLDAAEGDDLVWVDDLAADGRWPAFATAVVAELGVRSIISVRLRLESDLRAALNLYATVPGALTAVDRVNAAIFGSFVALALDAERALEEASNLQLALQTNRQIGIAIGILMGRDLITAEQAFRELREVSQATNRKLRDVAQDVIETGELPHAPDQRPG